MRENAGSTLVDCDVHNTPPTFEMLRPYLSDHWQETMDQSDFKGPAPGLYPAGIGTNGGDGDEGAPGLDDLQAHLFDRLGVDLAILNCAYAIEALHNPYGLSLIHI